MFLDNATWQSVGATLMYVGHVRIQSLTVTSMKGRVLDIQNTISTSGPNVEVTNQKQGT